MEFICEYLDHKGKKKTETLEAGSKKDVYKIISSRKGVPLHINPKVKKKPRLKKTKLDKKSSSFSFLQKKKLSKSEVVFLFYNLGIMIESGVSVDKAIEISAKQMKKQSSSEILRRIMDDVKRGMALSEAIKKSNAFPPLVSSVIMSGEEAGNLERSFGYLSAYYENQGKIKSKVVSALIYPAIVIVAIIIAVYIISTTVLPNILQMVEEQGTEIGIATKLLVYAADFFELTGIWSLVIIFGLPTAAFLLLKKMDQKILDFVYLKIPVIKDVIKQNASIQFTTTLFILLSSGITLNKALEICRDVVSNYYIQAEIEKVRRGIMKGGTISENLDEDIFGDVVCNIIAVGEESGNLVEPLEKSTKFLNEKMEETTKRMTELVAPITMMLIAVIVGIVVVGTMMPMMSVYQQ